MTKSIDMAESFLKRASNKLEEARLELKNWHHAESISASQECIELSMKATFLLLTESYPRKHEFKDEEFEPLLDKIPDDLKYLSFPRLYLLHKLWAGFYGVAKYGYERFGVGPEKLFRKEEAELAIKHAEDCKRASDGLLNRIKYPPK